MPKLKLTPELQIAICQYVAGGNPLPYSCEASGVSWETVRQWLRKGRSDTEGQYYDFNMAVRQARSRWVVSQVANISKYESTDWKASAWLLERRVPEFRPPRRLEVTGAEGGPIQTQQLSDAEIAAQLAAIAEKKDYDTEECVDPDDIPGDPFDV